MARRGRNDIEVGIIGEADFGRARKDAARDLSKIEGDAKDAAKEIEKAFDRVELSPELDTTEIREAVKLARDLDGMVARFDIDTDLSEIQQAEKIARSLRSFQGRVDLSVEGRDELREVLGLAETMDQVRQVKVQVQGRQDLERAKDLAEDLEQTRTVRVDVDDSDIDKIDDRLTEAGERGADGIADAIGGIDFDNIGGNAVDSLTGALSAAGPWAAAAGAIGAVFADDLAEGITRGFNSRRNDVLRGITSGLSESDLAIAGEAAGDAWAAGFGESLPQLQADADNLRSILGDMASDADLTELVKQSQVLSQVLGVEVFDAAELARRQINQGLATDWRDAFDDMIGVTQEFGATGQEALEIVEEFGGNFARFEVDGGRAAQFVASAFRDGLVPTIDRAGEAFEEFTTRIVDADAADAIAELGLNFQQLQADVAAGGDRANDAMSQVIERLLTYGSEADRARLSNVIFGASFEQVSDHGELLRRLLELLGDETDAYAGKAEEAARAVEASNGGLAKAQRDLADTAAIIGDAYGRYYDSASTKSEAFFRTVLGTTEEVNASIEETGRITAHGGRAIEGLGEQGRLAAAGLQVGADGMVELADSTDRAVGSVRSLEEEFADLEGRFNASSGLRRIQEQAESLLDSVGQLEGGLFTAGGQFDRTDPAARRFESTLEDLNGTLITNAQNLADGTITTDQFRVMQHNAAEAIRAAGAEAGLTDAKIEALIAEYTRVPPTISTDVLADDSQARAELNRFMTLANTSTGTVKLNADTALANATLNAWLGRAARSSVTIPVRSTSSGGGSTSRSSSGGGTVNRRASGGPTTGLTLVGEEGPELLDLGSARGFVHDNASTKQMLGGGAATVRFELGGGAGDFERLVFETLRRGVKTRGGVDVVFA